MSKISHEDFIAAWKELVGPHAIGLDFFPRVSVDMGPQEQGEVKVTTQTEFEGLRLLLHRFRNTFGVALRPQTEIHPSPLVNPFGSSIVVADIVREMQRVREDRIDPDNLFQAVLDGLATILSSVRGHAAPRDHDKSDDVTVNHIEHSYLALLQDGQTVLSVGQNSLMDMRQDIVSAWAIDAALWPTLHNTDTNIRNALLTQYTARFHSPQMLGALVASQLEWLLENPERFQDLATPEGRREIQRRALTEKFFPGLQTRYERKRELMETLSPALKINPPTIEDISDRKDALIAPLPANVVRSVDDFGIVAFKAPATDVQNHIKPGESVYVTIEVEEYVPSEGDGASQVAFIRRPVTHQALVTDAAFSGHLGQLTLTPRLHAQPNGALSDTAELCLFAQMTSAGGARFPFHPSGAALAIFQQNGGSISVGSRVQAIAPANLIDPLLNDVRQSLAAARLDPGHVTTNEIVTGLVQRGLISYANCQKLAAELGDAEKRAALVKALHQAHCEAMEPHLAHISSIRRRAHQRRFAIRRPQGQEAA